MENQDIQAEKIKEHFNSDLIDYDTCCSKVVPKNEELHDTLVKSIPHDENKELRILDLGIGTSRGALQILNRFPNAQLTGIDFSSKMINRSKEKLKEFGSRVELIEGNFNKIDFSGKYDVIVSAVAIHNSKEEQQKQLIAKIYGSLNQGGYFIDGDFVKTLDEETNKKLDEFYKNFLKENLKDDELKAWLRHGFEEDVVVPLDTYFKWMKEIGFEDIECVWKYQNLAVFCGRKR
jgi:tRNA (cmo5U34)-methyltransferase